MQAAQHNHKPAASRDAEPMKRAASVMLVVRFVDNNTVTFYSRDIEYSDWRNGNAGYWTSRFQRMVSDESPKGWKGRVSQAAIFRCFDGNRGDKICQYNLTNGWHVDNKLPN